MIVTCPACQTRYLVEDAELRGEAGRRVRCASCGNLWHYSPDAAAIQTAVAEAAAVVEAATQAANPSPASAYAPASPYAPGAASERPAQSLRAEPGTQMQGRSGPAAPLRSTAVALPPSDGPSATRLGAAALILVAAALVLFLIFGRNTVMAVLPPTVPIYATLRMTEPPSAGLEITCVLARTADSVTVAGDIVNRSRTSRPLGPLRISLLDDANKVLETRLVAPPVTELPAGATARYETSFERPSIAVAAATTVTAD